MGFDLEARAREAANKAIDIWDEHQRWDILDYDLLDVPIKAAMQDTLKAAEAEARYVMAGRFPKVKAAAWGLMDLGAKEAADAIGRLGDGKGPRVQERSMREQLTELLKTSIGPGEEGE